MEEQDQWLEQPQQLDWNKVGIGVVVIANMAILIQAFLLYLFP